jgi:predicted AAA+ superfamily ATPase
VGKSYILFQLIEKINAEDPDANIIYVNCEDLEFSFIKNAQDLNDFVISKSLKEKMNYIFIDEIQEIFEFQVAIRSLALDENNDIYITGSNAQILSGDLATYLAGRYVEFTIFSLAYTEFLQFHNLEDSDESMESYFQFGGLPYLIHLPLDYSIVKEYLQSIYSTIVLRDVINRKKIRNTILLEKLIQFLANNVGNLFSSKSISDYLKSQRTELAPNQVGEYADALADSFIVHKIGRYDIVGKRLFERGEKFYFENLGIRHVVAGYRIEDRARILENIVCNHLLYLGYSIKVGMVSNQEIDFVCERSNERIYVQVAVELSKEETIKREFENLLKIKDNYPKMVVTSDKSFTNTYQGIKHVYIRDFLNNQF